MLAKVTPRVPTIEILGRGEYQCIPLTNGRQEKLLQNLRKLGRQVRYLELRHNMNSNILLIGNHRKRFLGMNSHFMIPDLELIT